jgi:hypothetical protein
VAVYVAPPIMPATGEMLAPDLSQEVVVPRVVHPVARIGSRITIGSRGIVGPVRTVARAASVRTIEVDGIAGQRLPGATVGTRSTSVGGGIEG